MKNNTTILRTPLAVLTQINQKIYGSQPEESEESRVLRERILDQEIHNRIADAINKAYHDAYLQRLQDYGYRVRYKPTFKEKVKSLFTLLLTFVVIIILLYILWFIKPIREYLIAIYNENPFVSTIVDIFMNK